MSDGWIVKVIWISNDGLKSSMIHQDGATGDVIVYKDLEHAKREFDHMVLTWKSEDPWQWYGSSISYDVFVNRIRFKIDGHQTSLTPVRDKKLVIQAKGSCKLCHGSGTFWERHGPGLTQQMDCDCALEDLPDTWEVQSKIENGDYIIVPADNSSDSSNE